MYKSLILKKALCNNKTGKISKKYLNQVLNAHRLLVKNLLLKKHRGERRTKINCMIRKT